jgi:hypothetical protein
MDLYLIRRSSLVETVIINSSLTAANVVNALAESGISTSYKTIAAQNERLFNFYLFFNDSV